MIENNLEDLEPEERNRLIKEKQLASIESSPSKSLAAYVVAYRALGIGKDIAVACMGELAKRKADGDEFDFESYIEQEVSKIPQPNGVDYAKIIRGMQKDIVKKR